MPNEWQSAAAVLLREAFEGRAEGETGTWFVEGREGIFDALDSADAGRASTPPGPGSATLAAHAFHLRHLLRGANVYAGGDPPEGDWESSWKVQRVTDAEWRTLRAEIAAEYERLLPFVRTGPLEGPGATTGTLAVVVHVAYHLGAMRALLRLT